MFRQHPDPYGTLSKVGVYGHASGNEGISIQPAEAYPVLGHHSQMGSLMQVRWNTADRAGLFCPFPTVEKWYDAAS